MARAVQKIGESFKRRTLMSPALFCLTLAVITILFQNWADRNGFGQMIAWFRLTLLFIGVILLIATLMRFR
jgi:hypothetical protein